MKAKDLYKKHLKSHTDWYKGVYLSPSQLDGIKYDATLDAIQEALDVIEVLNETIEADRLHEELSSEGEE